VIATARDYLATWTPHELSLLPSKCRPGRVKSEQDLDALHATLVEEYRDSDLEGEALSALQRLTSFVVRACVRVAQLKENDESAPGSSGGGAPRSAGPGDWDRDLS
jgi:hypothetical protein